MPSPGRVMAVLGPTNTGKTHHAIERLLTHRSGIIGLPLRLLAREVYDRVVARAGAPAVALVTGEERILPDRPRYWVATTEAMPLDIGADFLCVDEIQLCTDPARGHVFTDRLLHARGRQETLFLGAETMRDTLRGLVPGLALARKERFSVLRHTGSKKISRMPERTAIVTFSVENLYAIAELVRRQKGGCAVVMGALSPRTRNAQVALYQNGDVDYLVATDAIGMGLNLDIGHVAFAATAKFDGRRMRALFPHEIGQIAGRAGRHRADGTFGITAEARPFPPELVEQVETHSFEPARRLMWRASEPDFSSLEALVLSLEAESPSPLLQRARAADDLVALKALGAEPEVTGRLTSPQRVRLLWDVCRIPDFRDAGAAGHARLLERIFVFLVGRGLGGGRIPSDWLARSIRRIDRTDGDIEAISRRLAQIRTWAYVAQRRNWVDDESHWRGETRAVEDRLSDALHERLTQRFVDRRTSVLLRRLKQKESLVAEVDDSGRVTVEGEFAGRLDGFRFVQDAQATGEAARTLRQAAIAALGPEFMLRADRIYNAPDTELDYTEQGGLMWGSSAVGKLVRGAAPLRPQVEAFIDEEAGPEVAERVRRRLQHFIDRKVATLFEPLLAMDRDEALKGLSQGFAFRLTEALGILSRNRVAAEVKALDQEARAALRRHGVRFGQYTVFLPALLKPAPTRLRLVLWSLWNGRDEFPESPPPGLVTIPNLPEVPAEHYELAGYRPAGSRAIRIDMLERLADLLRAKDGRAGFEATPEMLSITGLSLEQFADLMGGLGYRAERGERPRGKPAPGDAADGTVPQGGEPLAAGEAGAGEAEAGEAPTAEAQAGSEAAATEAEAPEATGPEAAEADAVAPEDGAPEDGAPDTVTPEGAAPEATAPEGTEPEGTAPADVAPEGTAPTDAAPREAGPGAAGTVEIEVYLTFTRAPVARPAHHARKRGPSGPGQPRGQHQKPGAPRPAGAGPADGGEKSAGDAAGGPGKRPRRGKGGAHGPGPHGSAAHGPGAHGSVGPRVHEARPPRKERPIDPDNPFAALLALKGKV